jgi:4-hydroxybenzoate polyprenyltransferase
VSARPALGDVAELVRLPAVLTVPGDVLLGAAAAGWPGGRAAALAIGSGSALQYLAGMALNDYADREVDAVERPQRPVPSGRVSPRFALGLAASLTTAGIAAAALAGGPAARRRALALAGAVWAYDLVLKQGPAGPPAMAAARFTDVLMGAGGRTRTALPAAAVVGAHTLAVTVVSRREATGGSARLGDGALVATGAVSAAAAAFAAGRGGGGRLLAAGALLGVYAGSLAGAARAASRQPSARNVQRVVGTGIVGLLPLQASMLVAAGATAAGAAVAGAWPLARSLARRRAVT